MNRSLDQLKSFLLEHTQSESFRNGKMEKAEILEMTVQYLKNAALANGQEHEGTEVTRQNYEAGFKECLLQVNSFVRSCARFNAQTKSSLMERLAVFVDESTDENHGRRLPESSTSTAPNLPPLRPGQRGSECRESAVPSAANAMRPMAVVPAVTSHPATHKVSNVLAARPPPSYQTRNHFNVLVKTHELDGPGSAHFRDFPQKVIVSPKPVFAQQGSATVTVSHNVWRPWP
ncbi:transcription factor HES-7.1-A-like [Heptranchias perlo]|uniref:transcription factor HES-7.1-A-like n=1 Tax=Heptranchias perlo TaxID=212740 RepID=UPI003559EEFB